MYGWSDSLAYRWLQMHIYVYYVYIACICVRRSICVYSSMGCFKVRRAIFVGTIEILTLSLMLWSEDHIGRLCWFPRQSQWSKKRHKDFQKNNFKMGPQEKWVPPQIQCFAMIFSGPLPIWQDVLPPNLRNQLQVRSGKHLCGAWGRSQPGTRSLRIYPLQPPGEVCHAVPEAENQVPGQMIIGRCSGCRPYKGMQHGVTRCNMILNMPKHA